MLADSIEITWQRFRTDQRGSGVTFVTQANQGGFEGWARFEPEGIPSLYGRVYGIFSRSLKESRAAF